MGSHWSLYWDTCSYLAFRILECTEITSCVQGSVNSRDGIASMGCLGTNRGRGLNLMTVLMIYIAKVWMC